MFKKKTENILLADEDILHSLNYNIVLTSRENSLTREKILYSTYKVFNYQSEINQYYSKKDDKLYIHIAKLDKLKQLMNNIALYLEIPTQEILYKEELNIVYCNIYKLVEKYDISKKFNFITFFKKYDWIIECKKSNDNILKVEFIDKDILCYSYNILEEKYFVITASKNENEFIILDPIGCVIKFGIKYFKNNIKD